MNVQQISFNNNLNQPEQKLNSGSVAFASESDKFESSNKKDSATKYIFAGFGVIGTIVAIVKHKQIGEFFTKLFKRGEKAGNEVKSSKSPIKDTPPVVPPKPKFELPKPEFKYDKTNPVEFAKEKDAYIEKISNYASKNEDMALAVMKQFNDYGSREHLSDLVTNISLIEPKTDKLAKAYLETYKKLAKFREANEPLYNRSDSIELRFFFDNFKNVLSKDTIMLMIKEFKRTGCCIADTTNLELFTEYDAFMKKFDNKDFEEIKTSALDAIDTIKQRGYTWK